MQGRDLKGWCSCLAVNMVDKIVDFHPSNAALFRLFLCFLLAFFVLV